MFCTKCGIELKDQDKFCSQCGVATPLATAWQSTSSNRPSEPLSRPMSQAKLAGVCAGFARYFGVDVTLVRVLWVILTVCPVPSLGLVAYIVAWIVMPKDPVTMQVQVHATNGPLV